MLAGVICSVFALICFPAARIAFKRKDKGYGMFFSIFGIAFFANAIYSGFVGEILRAILDFLIAVKNIIVFLIIGRVHIPIFGIYILLIIAFLFGIFVAAWRETTKASDDNMVDTVELGKRMRRRDK